MKGFKFVPTRRKVDIGKLVADIKTWERRMRLREYFFDNENEEQDQEYSKQRKSSDWTPNSGRDLWLDLYVETVRDDIIKGLHRNFKMNITENEEKALKELLYDDSIVIRPSDKSSAVVIMNKSDYEDEVYTELEDNGTYKTVKDDLTTKIENKIKKCVESMYKRNIITKEMRGYLLPKGSRPGKVQGNPKIHKKNHPLRTIVNGNNHATENMTEVVENELEENVKNFSTYIKDTTDFLRKLQNIQQPLTNDTIMFCLDVKALYPSVPRLEARDACEQALKNRTNPTIPTECVLEMLDLVLENNHFSFNGKNFIRYEISISQMTMDIFRLS